jgi:hypothetical protein
MAASQMEKRHRAELIKYKTASRRPNAITDSPRPINKDIDSSRLRFLITSTNDILQYARTPRMGNNNMLL